MAAAVKKATNLTGLAVCPNPKYVLNRLYKLTLNLLSKMPERAAYRKYTEELINYRSNIINSTDDVKVMEEKIACGQIEEVILQAKREYKLAETFILARPWENLRTPIPKNQWKWPVK